MESRIAYGEQPPENKRVEFKNPYTLYARPDFNIPKYIYEIRWREKLFGGKRTVISKFVFDTEEECKTAFENHKLSWYGEVLYEIDEELEKEHQKILAMAREARENYKRIQKTIDEYYPTGLMEYMERLRRKKWVKDKRKRERIKLMSMNPIRAEEYIKDQMEKFDKEEEACVN